MRYILKGKWLVVALWLGVTAALFLTAPDMSQLVREKGQIKLPDDMPSSAAWEMLQEKGMADESEMSVVLVVNRLEGLTSSDEQDIQSVVKALREDKQGLGIKDVLSYSDREELKNQLLSQDGTTAMIPISLDKNDRSVEDIRGELTELANGVKAEHYLTGQGLILEDVVISSEEGLKKTELITVGFILVVLLLVFRSAVAPFVPLITVGLSYLISQSVVAFLVDRWNFPLSNFTQIFLVGVLFGIGTDYCILLLSRLKEEMGQGGEIEQAVIRTYRSGGRTVFYAALAGMVGFATLGLAKFNIYQSAVAVALGIIVLIAALLTLVPALMGIFGKMLFWPAKGIPQHKQSKLWETAGKFSLKRPLVALLIVAAVVVPFLATYNGTLSYDSMKEIGNGYDSVKGYELVADSFGPGEVMSTKIVIQDSHPLDNQEGLVMIERVSREVAKLEGVSKVRSASRPLGEPLDELQVSSQAGILADGLEKGNAGIDQIRSGLSEAVKKLEASAPDLEKASGGIGQLVQGTDELNTGVEALRQSLLQVESGLRQGSAGAEALKAPLNDLKKASDQLAAGSKELTAGYGQVADGLTQLSGGYQEIGTQLNGVTQALKNLDANFAGLTRKYPQLAADIDFQTIVGTVTQARQGLEQLSQGLTTAQTSLNQVIGAVQGANQGLKDLSVGNEKISAGLAQVGVGVEQLKAGFDKAAGGQSQIITGMAPLTGGLAQFKAQSGALAGLSQMTTQLGELSSGLSQSVTGLGQISEGLQSAGTYLSELAETDRDMTGLNIPAEVFERDDFRQVLDMYMSKDRTLTTVDVILTANPYSKEALDTVEKINEAANRALQGTKYAEAKVAISGVSSNMADLRESSGHDYQRTVILMLTGIALILIVLLRSITMPIYLIASLLLCYYTSMSVTELVFVDIIGYPGMSWAVQFFGFVILMALGVDYSIFLMDRFNEERHGSVKEGLLNAMKNMGTVIISAVIILSGTFAAMMPAGVLSLLQIATAVLTGLLLYAFIILPLFVPVMVKIFGQGNWWPFNYGRKKEAE